MSSNPSLFFEIIPKAAPVAEGNIVPGTDVGIITHGTLVEPVGLWFGSAAYHVIITGIVIKGRYFADDFEESKPH